MRYDYVEALATQVLRHFYYYYYSRRKFLVRNVIVQTVFRIVSAVSILKTISGIEWDIL